jgi:hypothetical protein
MTYGADGKVETVRYSELVAMLSNELQKQTRENGRQAERIRTLESERAAFEERLLALEQTVQANNGNGKLAAAFDK